MDNNSAERTVGFANDVRPLFEDIDVDHMSFKFDLSSYDDVKGHASGIFDAVSNGRMPPKSPWDKGKIDTFKAWMDGGYQP